MRRAPLVVFALLVLTLSPSFSALSSPSPAAFPTNVRVTTVNGPANEVHIAVNPLNPSNLIAAAKDYTLGASGDCGEPGGHGVSRVWAGYYWSTDGGATWGNGLMPGYPNGPVSPLTGYLCSSDPVVAFDGLGNAHYLGLAYNTIPGVTPVSPSALWIGTSLDQGATYPVINKFADLPGTVFFNDKEWFAFDPTTNMAYVTWTEFYPFMTNIMLVRCAVGIACSPPEPLSVPLKEAVQGSAPAVGPDGTVHVIWLDYASRTVRYASALHGGAFLPDVSIGSFRGVGGQPNSNYRTPTMPAIAVDTSGAATNGNLYVVWTDAGRDGGDIHGVRSTDGGATWSAVFRINDDAAGKQQFFPAVSVAPNGRVDVAFYDRRDDPNNRLNTLYVASSSDGGATWSNTRVSDVAFDGNLGCKHQAGFTFMGDYIGIASTNTAAHPLWADSRTGRCEVFTAALPR